MNRVFPLGRDLGRLTVRKLVLWLGVALLAAVLIGAAARPIGAGAREDDPQVAGAGKTIIEGGGPGLIPVTTVLAFHANGQGGDFECLALIPQWRRVSRLRVATSR